MERQAKKREVLQKWAIAGKKNPDYSKALKTLLQVSLVDFCKKKFPEKVFLKESALLDFSFTCFSSVPLKKYFEQPELFEKEILDFVVEPEVYITKTEFSNTTKECFTLDLRGVPCPDCSLKARNYLFHLKPETKADIFLDSGSPIENVPMSLIADGCKILSREKKENFFKISVLKQKKEI